MDKILFIVALILGSGGDIFWAYIANWPKRRGKAPLLVHAFKYHVHHSVLGLTLIIVGLLTNAVLAVFGLGIIVSHTIRTGKFVFIEKRGKGE